jgi:hypothetical protein
MSAYSSSTSKVDAFVDARQRNERNARMGAAKTGWLCVRALSGSADFTGKLNISTLRLKGSHFVYEKAVPNKPQNKKHSIRQARNNSALRN